MSSVHKIIEINDIENNVYYKNNSQYFLQLKSLIENNLYSYVEMLKANGTKHFLKAHPNYIPPYKHLRLWIDDILKNTKITNAKYPEKCYWILHNMTDYNFCQNINCTKYITKFVNIIVGYRIHCSGHCAATDPLIVKKREETNLKNNGVKYPAQNKEIWHKVEKTCLKKYNNKNILGSKYAIEKSKQTKLKKYGNKNYTNPNKAKQTKLKIYGTACSPSYSYYYDNKSFDSSWEVAYYIWLKDNNIKFKLHPQEKIIHYIDKNNKEHIYTPDFWIIDTNEIIDIKGNQFFDNKGNLVVAYNNCSWKLLYNVMLLHHVKLIRKNEIKQYLDYISQKYGKNYLQQFKKSKQVQS